ncbi:MAG: ribonuclease P protein component [Paenibacillaceae bacterium]
MQQQYRLVKKEDFNKVYRYGKSAANMQYVIYYKPNIQVEQFRMGVSASKKLGGAVVRNRLRRVIKEIIRHHADEIVPHNDLIVIVRKPAVDLDYQTAEKCLLHALKRASMIKKK